MLASELGIRLVLLVGENVPRPAPYEVTSALVSAKVTNDGEGGDGFEMTFTLGKGQSADYRLLRSGVLEPFTRVIVGVLLGVTPRVLIDGVITHHELSPGDEPGLSTLTVKGRSISLMLDLEERNEKYENQPDSVIFARIIGRYARFGLFPQPSPTTEVPIEIQRIPQQHGTDLDFIRNLANRNGFVFYVEPLTFGVNRAYFGPENRLDVPQPALSTNLGPARNVEDLYFHHDALASAIVEGALVDPFTKLSLPIPQLPSLKVPPLSLGPLRARRKRRLRNAANQNAARAAVSALAETMREPDPIKGYGRLDTVRYGHVLKARGLVGVRGAGETYDGFYYVRAVTHTISPGSYTQSFTLSREGTGSSSPVVRTS
jgi:hypothetical protein